MILTLLFAIGASIDAVCWAGRNRGTDATTGGDCSRRFLQGALNEDFIDGHSSEVREVTPCSRDILDMLITQVARTYRYRSLERHKGDMEMLKCKW